MLRTSRHLDRAPADPAADARIRAIVDSIHTDYIGTDPAAFGAPIEGELSLDDELARLASRPSALPPPTAPHGLRRLGTDSGRQALLAALLVAVIVAAGLMIIGRPTTTAVVTSGYTPAALAPYEGTREANGVVLASHGLGALPTGIHLTRNWILRRTCASPGVCTLELSRGTTARTVTTVLQANAGVLSGSFREQVVRCPGGGTLAPVSRFTLHPTADGGLAGEQLTTGQAPGCPALLQRVSWAATRTP